MIKSESNNVVKRIVRMKNLLEKLFYLGCFDLSPAPLLSERGKWEFSIPLSPWERGRGRGRGNKTPTFVFVYINIPLLSPPLQRLNPGFHLHGFVLDPLLINNAFLFLYRLDKDGDQFVVGERFVAVFVGRDHLGNDRLHLLRDKTDLFAFGEVAIREGGAVPVVGDAAEGGDFGEAGVDG